MNFLAPLFLLGGLAVALPIIFHLVRRSSREKQLFSSLMFLRPTPPRMTRRNRLENIFLLLLRCLAICILALGFARPLLQKPMAALAQGPGAARILVLVDTSASMQREGLWTAAMQKAKAVLNATTPADQVAVFTFDDRVNSIVSFEEWAGLGISERASSSAERLAALQPTWHATHIGNALIAAVEALEDADKREQHSGPKRIVLISDLQEGGRLDSLQGYEWPRDLEVVVETIKPKRPTNAGLQWVLDAEHSGNNQAGVRLRVSNSADADREQFQLRWAGNHNAPSLDAYVPPGQSRIISALPAPTNVVSRQIVLSGDDSAFDNIVYVVQPKAEEVSVLVFGNEPETDPDGLLYYLKRAFQDTRRQVVRLKTAETANQTELNSLSTNRLLIISRALPDHAVTAVRQFLTNGGTALFVLTDASLNSTLARLGDAPQISVSEASVANYAMFGSINFEHPLFAPFADPRFSDFTKIRFWKHRKISADDFPDARVLARFDDQDPAILEIPAGRGHLFVFTSSWKPADSQLALSSKFIPLIYSVLDQAGGIQGQLAQYRVGDTVELAPVLGRARRGLAEENSRRNDGFSVRKPDGSMEKITAGEARFVHTDKPGIYDVLAPDASVLTQFAVNLDAAESKTSAVPLDELERLGLPMKVAELDLAKQAAERQLLHNAELENQQKLWRWLILGALGVLLVETWLAGWISRRSAAVVVE